VWRFAVTSGPSKSSFTYLHLVEAYLVPADPDSPVFSCLSPKNRLVVQGASISGVQLQT
ncbi:Hypothetical predicted protein, partial [Pelobates cultripes]